MAFVWMGKNFYKKLFQEECRVGEKKEKRIRQLESYAELVRYIASFDHTQQLISIVPYSSYPGQETYIVFLPKGSPETSRIRSMGTRWGILETGYIGLM